MLNSREGLSSMMRVLQFATTTGELHRWKTNANVGCSLWACHPIAFSLLYLCLVMEAGQFARALEPKSMTSAAASGLQSAFHAAAEMQSAVAVNSGTELYDVLSTPLTHDLAVTFQGKCRGFQGSFSRAKSCVISCF
jgi:hypothetical protein